MKERLLNTWQTIKEKFLSLSLKTRRLLIGSIVFCLLFSVGVAVWLNTRPYAVLFNGLSNEEASEIIGKLQEDGVEYKYQNDGTILVSEKEEEDLRAKLVYEGYPKSGFTYDFYLNNVSLTSTESEKEHYKLLDLQKRMSSTVALFPNIKEAVVTIALGEDNRYVLQPDDVIEATASVTVTTDDGEEINKKEVKAIQRLVSKSIKGAKFDNVVVICNGVDVTIEEENESSSFASELKASLENEFEKKISKEISSILLSIYGEGNYKVSVKSDINVDKTLREFINYSAEDPERNTGVITQQGTGWQINRNQNGEGGVPGTETNSDIPVYTTINSDGTESFIGADGDIDYLVDQLKEQTQVLAGNLTDLSVAVIINGNDLGGISKEELTSLIAKAAGINRQLQNEKIEIVNVPFFTEDIKEAPKDEYLFGNITKEQFIMLAAITAGVLLLLILLIVAFVLRRRKKKKELEALKAQEEASLSPEMATAVRSLQNAVESNEDLSEDLLNLKNEKGMELKRKIREFAEENPEISAQLLKVWLKGGEK